MVSLVETHWQKFGRGPHYTSCTPWTTGSLDLALAGRVGVGGPGARAPLQVSPAMAAFKKISGNDLSSVSGAESLQFRIWRSSQDTEQTDVESQDARRKNFHH